MNRQFYILLLLFFATASIAQKEWSLERCILHAIENNLLVKQSEINVDFAKINEKQAKHGRYPNLSLSTNLNSNFGRSTDPITNTNVTQNFISNGISMSSGVTLFNGFRIANSIKQSAADVTAGEYDLEQIKRDISLNVANNFLSVLFADENLAIAKTQLSTSEEQLKQTQQLINAGVRPANEALDILAQIANNEQLVIAAENSKQIALLGLKQLLRLEPDVSMILTTPSNIAVESDPDVLNFTEVYTSALRNQYDIKAADKRIESARLGEKIAKSALYPNISFFGSLGSNYSNRGLRVDEIVVERINQTVYIDGLEVEIGTDQNVPILSDNPYVNQLDENLSYGFGLGINYPIYSNYTNKAGIERAKLNIINAQTQSEQAKDLLKTTVQQALADAKASKRKLNAAERSRDAQNASFNNAEKRFNAGAINTFEYVTIKNALLEAEVNAVLSKYEYLFAMKVLDFYMGKPIKI
ncbi:MAG: TolC family protein [Saprospiraceae bacterium]|nr:TolC family protein [Saprospiraceae bacterium]